jgi:hypothetical protein
MTPERVLHTFARRYCIERHRKWTSEYAALSAVGKDRRGADYTAEAYAIFPRYNVLHAILLDVEMLDFDQLPHFDELSERLVLAGKTGTTEFTGNLPNPIARNSEREERQFFVGAVRDAVANGVPEQRPLHYRRTLSAAEVDELWRKLRSTWGITEGYWYPLETTSHPSLLAFDLDGIDEPALQRRIRGFFKDKEIRRIWELREFGRENYCVEAGCEDLAYRRFGEGYWTSDEFDWIVYCSHEGTITLGGSITAIAPPNALASDWS